VTRPWGRPNPDGRGQGGRLPAFSQPRADEERGPAEQHEHESPDVLPAQAGKQLQGPGAASVMAS